MIVGAAPRGEFACCRDTPPSPPLLRIYRVSGGPTSKGKPNIKRARIERTPPAGDCPPSNHRGRPEPRRERLAALLDRRDPQAVP